jgi:hypothetical protein
MPSLLEEDHQVLGLVVEVLYVEHCPNFPAALALVQRVAADLGVDVEVRTTPDQRPGRSRTDQVCGIPTVRVDGRDVDPRGELDGEYTLDCRLHWHEHRLAGYPQERSVRDALLRAAGPT